MCRLSTHWVCLLSSQLLHVSLKREKIVPSSPELVAMLDPFIPLIATTIKSKHVSVSLSLYYPMLLRCITLVAHCGVGCLVKCHFTELMRWYQLCLQIISAALRCLQWMFKFPLPSLSLHQASFTHELFSILGRHARRGSADGANQDLVLTAFKTMTAVIRGSQGEDVSKPQLQVSTALPC